MNEEQDASQYQCAKSESNYLNNKYELKGVLHNFTYLRSISKI